MVTNDSSQESEKTNKLIFLVLLYTRSEKCFI